MTLEALKAADYLINDKIDAEVIDLRSVRPLDEKTIIDFSDDFSISEHSIWR